MPTKLIGGQGVDQVKDGASESLTNANWRLVVRAFA